VAAITYDAFISYRSQHEKFALTLEKALEAYSPPAFEGARERKRGPLNVFRDGEDLAGSSVCGALDNNLERSAKLVVLCSPGAASSSYVNHEITYFAGKHGADHIVALLLEGHPNERHNPPEQNAFPPALLDVLPDPLAIDCRTAFKRGESLASPKYQQEWHKLLGRLLDVDPVTFQQRERRRMVRRMWSGAFASLALISAFGALAAYAFDKEQRADEARQRADEARKTAEVAMTKTDLALQAETKAREAAQRALQERDLAKGEAREASTIAEHQTEVATEASQRAEAAEGAAQSSRWRAQEARNEAESEREQKEQLRTAAINEIGRARQEADTHRANASELYDRLVDALSKLKRQGDAAAYYYQQWNTVLAERDEARNVADQAFSQRDAVQERLTSCDRAYRYWRGVAQTPAPSQQAPAGQQIAVVVDDAE